MFTSAKLVEFSCRSKFSFLLDSARIVEILICNIGKPEDFVE